MEGTMQRAVNKLARDEAYQLVLWLNKSTEALKTQRATLELAAEMASDEMGFNVTRSNVRDILKKTPELKWWNCEPITVDVGFKILAKNFERLSAALKKGNVSNWRPSPDLMHMASGRVSFVENSNGRPKVNNHSLFPETPKGNS